MKKKNSLLKIFLAVFLIPLMELPVFSKVEKEVALSDIPTEDGTYLVTVELDQKAELKFKELKRFLVTNTEVATVEAGEEGTLRVKATKIGDTFIHVWAPEGRKTIKLIVKRKQLPESTVAKREKQIREKKDTFKIGFGYEYVTTNIGTEFNKTKNDFQRHDYRITLAGDTPFAYVYGFARFQDFGGTPFEDAFTDGTIRLANFSSATRIGPYTSSGPTIIEIGPHAPIGPFQDFTLIGGDNFYNVTPFTVPWSLARGAFFSHTLFNERLDYTLLWAEDQEPIRFVSTEGDTFDGALDHFYSGGDFTWHFNDYLDWGASFFASYGDREETVSDHVVSTNYFLDFDWFTSEGEIAQTEDEIAWRIGADLYSPENSYHTGALYREIDEDFFAINGQTADRGEKGVLVKADAEPFDFLHLESTVDRYQDTLFPSETDPHDFNTDFIARSRIDLPWRTYFTATYRDAEKHGSLIGRDESAYSFQLNKTFTRIRGLGFFARYENRTVDNLRSSLLSYDRESVKVGGRWQLLRGLSLGVTQEWARVESTDEPVTLTVPSPDFHETFIFTPIESFLVDDRTSPSRLTADINYYTQVGKTPFWLDFRFRWEDEEDTESINSFFAGEDTIQGEVEISYIPSDSFKAFCRGRLEDRKSEISGERDLVEAELIVGANVLFDTGVRWDPQGMIHGMVFKDLNGNGILDQGEEGVPNIEVFLSDEQRMKTKENGMFDFGKVRGKLFKTTMDLQTVPSGYINTTPFTQDVSIRQGKVTEVYFGIIARSGVRGIVFNDINGNTFLDGEDKGLANVAIQLDKDRKAITDLEGRYYFDNVQPGSHEVALVLDSLPLNYIPKVNIKQTVDIAEGRIHTRYFPVQATRQISGKVFLDKNTNGILDQDEKGLERVMVAIGPNLIVTDAQGSFIFKNLPAGKHVIELPIKGIPQEYALATPASQMIELQEGVANLENIHFGLKKKESGK